MRLLSALLALSLILPAPSIAQVRVPAAGAFHAWTQIAPHQIPPVYTTAVAQLTGQLDLIAAIPHLDRTFENTIRALDHAYADFEKSVTPAVFMAYVSPDRRTRKAASKVEGREAKFLNNLSYRRDIYEAVQTYASHAEPLTGEDARLLAKTLRDYRQMGMDLPKTELKAVKRLQLRLDELELAFGVNLRDHKDEVLATRSELKGLPDSFLEGLEKTSDGRYKVTLDYPTFLPVMKLAQNVDLRRNLQFKSDNQAAEKNLPLLEEALRLRDEKARKLGYPTFAHMRLEDRMAETPEKVRSFLDRLKGFLAERSEAEGQAMLERKRQDDPQAKKLERWDRSFYGHLLKKDLYDFDPETVKEYFPIDRVVEGTLDIYQELLGLKFREIKTPSWSDDVRLFEITNEADGRVIGHFYLDLYPREGKYKHMAAFSLIRGREHPDGRYEEPVSSIVGNFSKPTGGRPALLRHSEVETFFHEFGHIMHQTLTRAKHPAFSGTSVARDFVEAPSQMMENWVWQPEVLLRLSGHFEDPERKLPREVLEKMLKAKNFNAARGTLGQIALALFDLTLHLGAPVDIDEILRQVSKEVGVAAPIPGTHWQASFGHLMGGYQAGYYGYLWSLVYAQDIFSRFERDGIFNRATGMDYRRKILERGSTVEESQFLEEFLGREPNEEAFLRSLGIDLPPESGRIDS